MISPPPRACPLQVVVRATKMSRSRRPGAGCPPRSRTKFSGFGDKSPQVWYTVCIRTNGVNRMEKGSMGQMVMCAIGGLAVGTVANEITNLGKIPCLAMGLLLGMMVDIYLSFYHKKKR